MTCIGKYQYVKQHQHPNKQNMNDVKNVQTHNVIRYEKLERE